MNNGSTLTGSLAIEKRADGTGGNLSVEGTLSVNHDGEMVNVLDLVRGVSQTTFTHTQTEESALWQIDHPLQTQFPKIKIFVGGKEVISRILYESATATHIDICFVNPCCGAAILTL